MGETISIENSCNDNPLAFIYFLPLAFFTSSWNRSYLMDVLGLDFLLKNHFTDENEALCFFSSHLLLSSCGVIASSIRHSSSKKIVCSSLFSSSDEREGRFSIDGVLLAMLKVYKLCSLKKVC